MESKNCIDCHHIERTHNEFCCGLEPVKKVVVASGYHYEGLKCVDVNPKHDCVTFLRIVS